MEQNNWIIDVETNLQKYEESNTTLIEKWRNSSIYKIPECITKSNEKAYYPQVVSFGPFHHGKDHLKPMETHKQRTLLHFLKRSNKPLMEFVHALSEPDVVQRLMDSYEPLDEYWKRNTEEFLQLMIVDGCFMLEVMRFAFKDTHGLELDYAEEDPIFSDHGKLYHMPFIKRDMLMLENQLPMTVLYRLLEVESGEKQEYGAVHKVILDFCFWDTSARHTSHTDTDLLEDAFDFVSKEIDILFLPSLHVLEIYRKSLLRSTGETRKKNKKSTGETSKFRELVSKVSRSSIVYEFNIRSATQLQASGISFRESESIAKIKFENGVLCLPKIVVDDATETTYLNLIAFEHLQVGVGNDVTWYVFFMDNIIDNERDIELLHKNGIIRNTIGSDKAAANLFNRMSKDTAVDPHGTLYKVHKAVNAYYNQTWHEWRANLIDTYFKSPWALLSLLAALLLFALTIIQTFYAVYPYYHK